MAGRKTDTQSGLQRATYYLSQADRDKLSALSDTLFPGRGGKRYSDVISRLLKAARVESGLLVADEREMWKEAA